MSNDDRKVASLKLLQNLKSGRGKGAAGVGEAITILQDEAATKGLDNEDIELIIDVIKSTELRAGTCVPLIKCLIPKKRVPEEAVEDLINFWLNKCNELPVTVSSTMLQWLTGLWEYQLVERQTINVYYDCFFFNMLKKERLELHIARLIYLLTKPEDVTRRQVLRLLRLQDQYTKPPKHLSALLSLFKSYKPELVPEKIPSLNIESVFKPIPEVLRLGFEDAKSRNSSINPQSHEQFDWNVIKHPGAKTSSEELLPSIKYFQMGPSLYRNKSTKSIFDLSNIIDVGKYYFNVELPTNATSLLANTAGYHFLTFANYEYQSRFSHNLYTSLRRAFIIESNRFTKSQKIQILEMSVDLCQYMQQGIPVLVRFLIEYLPYESGEFRPQLLKILEWCTVIAAPDLQENIVPYIEEMFLESSVEGKCAIIRSLARFLRNIFVNPNFGACDIKSSPFLGLTPVSELVHLIPIIIRIGEDLIVKGLNASGDDLLLINAALGFYEEIDRLMSSNNRPGLILPLPPVVYAAFLSNSCAILSRVCGLLSKYRVNCLALHRAGLRENFLEEIETLANYGKDLGNALWNGKIFAGKDGYFGQFREELESFLPKDAESRLAINKHIAVMPYIWTLGDTGLDVSGKDAALNLARHYFPHVSEFIEAFDQSFE